MMDIGAAFSNPAIFGNWFAGPSWDNWRVVLRGAFAERLTRAERAFFRSVAKREPPLHRVKELWIIAGRRAGKDSVASGIAAHAAASFESAGRLRPGERALVACLAVDKAQAALVAGYTRAFFREIPSLRALVERETADGLALSNGVDIAIMASDFRSIRGRTILCAILDECAYWKGEHSASPDKEVLRAIKPSMLTLSESMTIGISTAYQRKWSPLRALGAILRQRQPAYAGHPGGEPHAQSFALAGRDRRRLAGRPRGGEGRLSQRMARRRCGLSVSRSDRCGGRRA
jgi:hypothetical protein